MKLIQKKHEFKNHYFHIQKKNIPCLDSSWHYHSQYELIYIYKSTGIRFLGDNVSEFGPGELVLVGPYMPHLWRNNSSYYETKENRVGTIVIQFTKEFMGENIFNRTEFSSINIMLEKAKSGLKFSPEVAFSLHQHLMDFIDQSPVTQMANLLIILETLSLQQYQTISATDMRQYTESNSQRIDKVLKYISDHYMLDLGLDEIADVANMSSTSFCRFFKSITNQSFLHYLSNVRIQNAKRLLAQEEFSINEIADYVGFQTISNFNKMFKRLTGMTPTKFRENLKE